jgi:hypothetical protein
VTSRWTMIPTILARLRKVVSMVAALVNAHPYLIVGSKTNVAFGRGKYPKY